MLIFVHNIIDFVAQKMKFSIKDFLSKCDQIYRKLLKAVNYYHRALHLRCCSSPRSASKLDMFCWQNIIPKK